MLLAFFPAIKSIDRYRQIEEASGTDFYHEVGFLTIRGPQEDDTYKTIIDDLKPLMECYPIDRLEPLNWPSNCKAYFQPKEAGYINPRSLIKAQQSIGKFGVLN